MGHLRGSLEEGEIRLGSLEEGQLRFGALEEGELRRTHMCHSEPGRVSNLQQHLLVVHSMGALQLKVYLP